MRLDMYRAARHARATITITPVGAGRVWWRQYAALMILRVAAHLAAWISPHRTDVKIGGGPHA